MSYVLYVADCETTGTNHKIHDIIELSMIRIDLDNGKDEQKTWHMKPLNPAQIEDKALEVTGYKREDILGQTKEGKAKFVDPKSVITQVECWIMEDDVAAPDRVLIGQNIEFDKNFLESLWKKLDSFDTFPFMLENNNRMLDTKQLALLIDICTGVRRKYYNLGNLVKDFGVKKGKAHIAAEDTRMTKDLFVEQINPIKEFIKNNYSDKYDKK